MRQPIVLLVDDDPGLLASVSARLRELGADPVTFIDLPEAMEAAEKIVPDLIVLDLHMPTGNGLEACERLSQHDRLRSAPLILLTGEGSLEVRSRTKYSGARFVRKGVHLWDRLRPAVEASLGLVAEPAQRAAGG